jgi:hypothetical protein
MNNYKSQRVDSLICNLPGVETFSNLLNNRKCPGKELLKGCTLKGIIKVAQNKWLRWCTCILFLGHLHNAKYDVHRV